MIQSVKLHFWWSDSLDEMTFSIIWPIRWNDLFDEMIQQVKCSFDEKTHLILITFSIKWLIRWIGPFDEMIQAGEMTLSKNRPILMKRPIRLNGQWHEELYLFCGCWTRWNYQRETGTTNSVNQHSTKRLTLSIFSTENVRWLVQQRWTRLG